jgi:AcrR family transcriptional regulator
MARARTELSPAAIAKAAIWLCDKDGVDALSMRKVAARLGVGTMSLYHYVANKDELLVLMSDEIMGELVVEDLPSGWRDGLRAIATSTKAAFDRHGWMIQEMLSGEGQGGPNHMAHFEQSVSTLSDLELDRFDKLHVLSVVDEFTFGFIMHEALDSNEAADEDKMAEAVSFIEEQLATGEFPHTAAMMGPDENLEEVVQEMFASVNQADRFTSGLDIMLDGIEAFLRRKGAI